jgi:hypothetical protein
VNNEIADICERGTPGVLALNGTKFTVAKEWSNAKKACIVTK